MPFWIPEPTAAPATSPPTETSELTAAPMTLEPTVRNHQISDPHLGTISSSNNRKANCHSTDGKSSWYSKSDKIIDAGDRTKVLCFIHVIITIDFCANSWISQDPFGPKVILQLFHQPSGPILFLKCYFLCLEFLPHGIIVNLSKLTITPEATLKGGLVISSAQHSCTRWASLLEM
jgi:hypothetical protein